MTETLSTRRPTASLPAVPGTADALGLRPLHWHRPLLVLAAAMVLLFVGTVIGMIVDDRELTGLDIWAKPAKFALSTAIYAVTLSWLIGQLRRLRRAAWIAGTIATAGLAVELVIIVGAALTGVTSHFNVSTAFNTALWSVMAFSIVVVWAMTALVAIALFRNALGDPARTLAIRAGVIVAIIGMGLAFLMTGPTAAQLDDFQGIAGAHTVGVADGGPGLPILGWSTVAGDLRIPHFVGMHALQLLPLAALLLELAARRLPLLATATVRLRLVRVVVATYLAVLALLTAQALLGQSIVAPAGAILAAGVAIAVVALAAAGAVLVAAGRERGR
jgi:hypothetical protein